MISVENWIAFVRLLKSKLEKFDSNVAGTPEQRWGRGGSERV